MKRIIIPQLPHHVIQRGLQGRQTFFNDTDYTTYLKILTQSGHRYSVQILAYCLMPDHVHLIAIPHQKTSLSSCLRTVHSRYTKYIHSMTGERGQFWQGKYSSHLLDEYYLMACARYIEINPVKREYVTHAEDWPWSSCTAHITGKSDALVTVEPLLEKVTVEWRDFLLEPRPPEEADLFYRHEKNGRPLGCKDFLEWVANRQP